MKQNNNLSVPKKRKRPPPEVVNFAKRTSFYMAKNGHISFYPRFLNSVFIKKQQESPQKKDLSILLRNLQIEITSQIDECFNLWQRFTPKNTLFDTWDFRFAFWKGYQHKPHFISLKTDSEIFALLPLWYESDRKKYFWFGSWWQEENNFFVKDSLFIPLLLAICPSPVALNALNSTLPLWIKDVIKLKPDDPKYILNLKYYKSSQDFLSTLKKKKRYNLKRDKRIIESKNPKIIYNDFSHFDTLVELSNKRFHQKGEETDWEDPRRVETFRQVIKIGQKNSNYKVRMITVVIGEKIAAVDLVAIYNGCYYPLKCGYDVVNFSGIGNYINLLEIDDAINLGMKKMDFLEIGYGWKDKWFEEIPLFQYIKKSKRSI